LTGATGFWDEVLLLGMIGGLLALLLAMSIFGGRRKKGRGRRKAR
jgi:hypothetical protein